MKKMISYGVVIWGGLMLLAGCVAWSSATDSSPSEPAYTASAPGLIFPVDSPSLPERGYYLGLSSILPQDSQVADAYQQAAKTADFVNLWVGSERVGYWNLGEHLAGSWGKTFLAEHTRGNGMFPIVNLSFIDKDSATGEIILKSPKGEEYAGLADPAFRSAYKQGALEAVKVAQPRYLSLGNEVNRWYEEYGAEPGDINGFQHFVTLYEEIYWSVKELSPKTRVFCIFAREMVAENRQADLSVLSRFDPQTLDLLVYTSYPFAVGGIDEVKDIPDDYYVRSWEFLSLPEKTLGFTEVAWSSHQSFGGEEAQAEFLRQLTGRLTGSPDTDLELLGWWSLYDLQSSPHRLGLLSVDGREKEVYRVWKNLAK